MSVVAGSLVVQAIFWLSDGGALTDFPGDEERFIFLAFQILGHFGGVPAFTVHMPGWPLMIAALLKVFGYESLWIVGIYNRVLLAAMAGATFLILGRFTRRSIAVSVAVLSLTMGYNDRLATFVLTDLPYGAASVFAVAALLPGLASVRAGGWLGLAGLALATKTLLRSTGILSAVCAAGVVLATTPGRAAGRARRALAVLVPVLGAVLVVATYNFGVGEGFRPPRAYTALAALGALGPWFSHTPDTPAVRQFAALVPEVSQQRLLQGAPDVLWVAGYRFIKAGHGDQFALGALAERVLAETLTELRGEYIKGLARASLVGLVYPAHKILLPARWWQFPSQPNEGARFERDVPACGLQGMFGPWFQDAWCVGFQELRAKLEFRPQWLGAAGTPSGERPLAFRMARNVRIVALPLYSGVSTVAALIYLLCQASMRRAALVIASFIVADVTLLLLFTYIADVDRYLTHVQPLCLVVTSLALVHRLDVMLSSRV